MVKCHHPWRCLVGACFTAVVRMPHKCALPLSLSLLRSKAVIVWHVTIGEIMSSVTDVTDASYEDDVLKSDVPVLIDFWATWCMPCKQIAPFVDQVAGEHDGKLKVVKVDIGKHRKTAAHFGVTNIPTLIVVKGGKEVGRKVGAGGGLHALQKLVQPHV